jgi:hypothetical protein
MLRQIMTNDQVRLAINVPELALREGDVGTVRSSWYFPVVAFEVEFGGEARRLPARVLLLEDQIQSTFGVA